MIELNMKFNKCDLFYKKPVFMCLSSACISIIAKNLSLLVSKGTIIQNHSTREPRKADVSKDISFYCRCHYSGRYYNDKLLSQISMTGGNMYYSDIYNQLYLEEEDFSEEISFNFPNHADSINAYYFNVMDTFF